MHFEQKFSIFSWLKAALAALAIMVATQPAMANDDNMSVDGRGFEFYSPPGMENQRGPLLLVLHGGLSSASDFRSRYSLVDAAMRGGYHIAYLNGTIQGRMRRDRRTWNAGNCCGSANDQNIDDVGFISDVISALITRGVADPNRVFMFGSSNGAMMSYRMACERAYLIRGVISISGPLVVNSCANASGVDILHIHGRSDRIVPIDGGGRGNWLSGSPFPSVDQTDNALRAAGANVQLILLQQGDHGLQNVAESFRNERGAELSATVTQFIQAR
ncbi:MAG: hypothetical protein JKX69_04300 [Rhodobacteraceae bacterium]|nr:hypothetical protein [Paracoccaceae bacterium]